MIAAQKKRPITSSTCQKRPRSRYSNPWIPKIEPSSPNQPWTPPNSPIRLPKTTIASATSCPYASQCWRLASRPVIIGARKIPAARNDVETKKIASCTWKVRAR